MNRTPTGKQSKAKKPRREPVGGRRESRPLFATLKQNLVLATMAGILAFGGALAGAVITANVQKAIWEAEASNRNREGLTAKRIELIERTVALMGTSTAVIGQERGDFRSFITAMAKSAGNPAKGVGLFAKMLKEPSEARCRVAEAHAEFMITLTLDDIFFGQRTGRAVRALQQVEPWWEADSSLKADLIAALEYDFANQE